MRTISLSTNCRPMPQLECQKRAIAGWICTGYYRVEKGSLESAISRAITFIPHESLKAEVKLSLSRIIDALGTPAFKELDRGFSEPEFSYPKRLRRDSAFAKALFAELLIAAEGAAREAAGLPALANQLYVLVSSQCALDRDLAAVARVSVATPAPVIWSHGGRAYSCDGNKLYAVTIEENSILEAFMIAGKPMDTRTLTEKSGVTNVSRAIGRLRERYAGAFKDAIRPAAKKGSGGFFALVREAERRQHQG